MVLSLLLCRWLCSAHHLSPTRALHSPKTRPKYERLQRASPALARPPHLEQASLHMPHTTCFPPRLLDKHQIPSMCSARRLHAHVHALSTNKSQLVAPHMLNSFGNPIGSPNEVSRRSTTTSAMATTPNSLPCTKTKLSQQYLLQFAK